MRIVYQENERVAIAEADEISRKRAAPFSVLLRDGRTLNFPSRADVLTEFFDEVIVPAGDKAHSPPVHRVSTPPYEPDVQRVGRPF